MALAPVGRCVGGGSRIADFWRISAVFDPISGDPRAFSPASDARAAGRGSRIPGLASRAAGRGSRITASDAPAGTFGAGITGRGEHRRAS